MIANWDTCARMLGRSLSRYNGLTNSAKPELISDVVAGDLFQKKAFCYAYEIIQQFDGPVKARSAEVHLHHAIAFGFLYRAAPGSTRLYPGLANRQEATSHIALSALGRAFRSSKQLEQSESEAFRMFLWEYALMECDFDMYALLIKMSSENSGEIVDQKTFYDRYYSIQEKRLQWLKEKFPRTNQFTPIGKSIQWLKRNPGKSGQPRARGYRPRPNAVHMQQKPVRFTGETPSHHYKQRIKWAKRSFGHVDESQLRLTDVGQMLASCLPKTEDEPFFWLGPPQECANSRFFAHTEISKKQGAPAWNMLCPTAVSPAPIDDEIVEKVSTYMENAFGVLRLANFKQASLDTVIPYVHFLERKFGESLDKHELFKQVLAAHREKFVYTVRANLSQSYYSLRQK